MTTSPTDIYLPDHVYAALKERLTQLVEQSDDLHGTDAATEVVTALGEIGGVWPEYVLRDHCSVRRVQIDGTLVEDQVAS